MEQTTDVINVTNDQQQAVKKEKKKAMVKKIDLGIESETYGLSQYELNNYCEFEVSFRAL